LGSRRDISLVGEYEGYIFNWGVGGIDLQLRSRRDRSLVGK